MKEKTKISIELTGYKFEAEVDHDVYLGEMIELFKQLLICHKFSEKEIEDAFYLSSFKSVDEVD